MKFPLEHAPNKGKCELVPTPRQTPSIDPVMAGVITNAYSRFKNTPGVVLTQRWSARSGRQRFTAYALKLAAEEYRPGFIVGIALRDVPEVLVDESTLMWYPANLGKLLNNHCKRRVHDTPLGVGVDKRHFTCRTLDGVQLRFNSADEAHACYVTDRIKYFKSLLPSLGARPRAALEALIWRALQMLAENKKIDKF